MKKIQAFILMLSIICAIYIYNENIKPHDSKCTSSIDMRSNHPQLLSHHTNILMKQLSINGEMNIYLVDMVYQFFLSEKNFELKKQLNWIQKDEKNYIYKPTNSVISNVADTTLCINATSPDICTIGTCENSWVDILTNCSTPRWQQRNSDVTIQYLPLSNTLLTVVCFFIVCALASIKIQQRTTTVLSNDSLQSWNSTKIFVYLIAAFSFGNICVVWGQTSVVIGVSTVASSTQCPNPSSVYTNSVTGVVYAACSGGGVISISGTTVTTLANSTQCSNPLSVYTNSVTGVVYAACDRGGVISISGTTVTTLATSTQCITPHSVYTNSVTGVVYAACFGGGVISISGSTVTTLANSTQCSNPLSVYSNTVTGIVYAACSGAFGTGGSVISIIGTTVTTLANSTQCPYPYSVYPDSLTGVVYAACNGGGVISINGTTVTLWATPTQCYNPLSVYTNSVTGVVYAACYDGVISINGTTVTIWATSTQCPAAVSMYSNSVTGVVYAACNAGSVISIIGATVTTLTTYSQCPYPYSVYTNSVTGVVYAACSGVGVISISGSTVTTLANLAQCPTALSVYSDNVTGVVYAACNAGGVISISGSTVTTLANSTQCPNAVSVYTNTVTGIVYAACSGVFGTGGGVISISGATVTTLASSTGCYGFSSVYTNSVTGVVYAACIGGRVISISGTTVTYLATPTQCYSVYTNSVTGVVYAACADGGVISISGSTVTTLANLAQCPTAVSVYSDNVTGVVYAACNAGGVISISGTTVTTLITSSQCPYPSSVYTNSVTGMIYAACNDGAVISISVDFGCPPGYTFTFSGCSPCSLGQFRNYAMELSSMQSCSLCPAGSVAPVVGSTQCNSCPASTFAVSPLLDCMSCPVGSYSSVAGSMFCSPCAAGYYGSLPGFNSTCNGGCLPGYWCSQGSTNPTQIACGSHSVFCPSNSSAPIPVSPGMFTTASIDGSVKTMSAQTLCGMGSYCDGSGNFFPCPPGTFQNRTGQSSCSSCQVGSFSVGGAINCTQCNIGYTSFSSSSVCTPCAPGTFLDSRTLTCQPCVIGTYAPSQAAISCSYCSPGQFSNSIGSSYCSSCPPGQSNFTDPVTLIGKCINCPIGTYSIGGTSCLSCPVGFSASTNGSVNCIPCSPGTYIEIESSTCIPCLAGFYSSGGPSCSPCLPGFYSSSNSSFICTPCSQGSYSNLTSLAASSCQLCEPGKYQSGSASTSCVECAPQYYSNANGSISCQKCDTQVTPDHTQCVQHACPVNHEYDPLSDECDPCPLGTAGNGVCDVCAPSFYTPAPGISCTPCVDVSGLVCSGGLASVSAGYWAYLVNQSGISLIQTSPCPPDLCQGALLQNASSDVSLSSSLLQQCSSPRLNSPSNALCGQCEPGYVAWGTDCVSCTSANGGLFFAMFVLSIALVLFLLRSSGGTSVGSMAVLLYFAQTSMVEIGTVTQFLSWLQFINLGSHSLSCLAPWTPYQQTLFSVMVPVFLSIEVICLALAHYVLYRYHQRWSAESVTTIRPQSSSVLNIPERAFWGLARTFSVHHYVAGVMAVLLFSYTQASTASIQYLYCVDVGSSRVVFSAPSMDCLSDEYHAYLAPVLLSLILYTFGFPLCVFFLLWWNKDDLFASSSKSVSTISPTISNFLIRWSPLFEMFHPRAWFWQPLVLLRRSCFVLVSVLLVQQPSVRFMAFSFLNFGSLITHQLVRPYDSEILNHMESISYMLLVCISMSLTGYLPPYTLTLQVLLFLLVVPPTVVMTLYVVRQQWREVKGKIQLRKSTGSSAAIDSVVTTTPDQINQVELASYKENPLHKTSLTRPADSNSLSQRPLRSETIQLGSIEIMCDKIHQQEIEQQQNFHHRRPSIILEADSDDSSFTQGELQQDHTSILNASSTQSDSNHVVL